MEEVGAELSTPAAASADVLELHATGDMEDFQPAETNAIQEDDTFVNQHDETMDKEKLRKIKQKLKRSQNRRKKKLLTRNLKNFSATKLQQSVADLASGNAGKSDESFPVASLGVDNLYTLGNGHSEEAPFPAANPMSSWPNVSNPPVGAEEITVCVMELDNPSHRMSMQDLAYINEWLEKFMYKDLTITPKLKICNSFLSWSKQVWIICLTQYTSNWVIQKVKEIKFPNGRKISACLANEITGLTAVTMLVPKECGFIDNHAGLMRFLTIHNPTLNLGTTREVFHSGRSKVNVRQDLSTNENSTPTNQEEDGNDSSLLSQSSAPKVTEEAPEKPAPCTAAEQPSVCVEAGDLEAPRRARCFTFYADDTWVQELKQLPHGPFLGLRRLPFFLGERNVVRVGEAPLNSKDLRVGGGGGRNRRRRQHLNPMKDGTACAQ